MYTNIYANVYKIYLNILNAYCIDTMVILIVADKKILQIIIVLIKRFKFSEYLNS